MNPLVLEEGRTSGIGIGIAINFGNEIGIGLVDGAMNSTRGHCTVH